MGARRTAEVVAAYGAQRGNLLPILHDLKDETGFVAPGIVTEVARRLGLPRAHVSGVVAFYAFLSEEPRGRYRVLFGDDVTDVHAGSEALLARMRAAFGVTGDEVSRDGLVSIGTTSCTGLCDQPPTMLVNGRAIGSLTAARLGEIMALVRMGAPVRTWPAHLFGVASRIERRGPLLGATMPAGAAIDATRARGRDATLRELEDSGLRGRGGAGFSTARKLATCAEALAPDGARYVVCNADEGEPGTFKDRELLTHQADLVLEGMTVAAQLARATRGFLYLRAEYPFLVEPLRARIAARRAAGLLGPAIRGDAGFTFDVELRVGAGAYVCGEESALLESLEGRCGVPRSRPPYPVQRGFEAAPTAVLNVETLASVALVAHGGARVLRAHGTTASPGTKVFSVSGDVTRPGTYELDFGVTVDEVLALAGARDVQAVLVGGASGTLLTAVELHRRLAFEDVPCAGAVVVFDGSRDLLDMVARVARFFADESCGFCTPCRVGTTLVADITRRVASGHGARRDLSELAELVRVMRAASHCGLGHTAGNVVADALAKLRPMLDGRLRPVRVLPTFDLDAALAPAREVTGRDDPGAHLEEEGA